MKHLLGFTGSFLLLCLLITCIILPALPKANAEERSYSTETSGNNEQSAELVSYPESVRETYTISSYEGKIAVYRNINEKPVFISETLVSDLPLRDQDRILRGIEVSSERELKYKLEELCS